MKRETLLAIARDGMSNDDAYKIVSAASTTRKCGSCTACCFTLSVEDTKLSKADFTECPHRIKLRGCAVYEDRPEQCKHYFCLWKLGFVSRKDSPDKIGVIFDGMTDEAGNPYLRVSEVWDGALKPGTRGWTVMSTFPERRVFVLRKNGRTEWLRR